MATTATSTQAGTGAGAKPTSVKKTDSRPKTPWWMWLCVIGIVFYCLFPFYWLINLSLKTGADLSNNSLIPPNPSLANYKAIFRNDDFVRALGNSVWVAGWTTVLAITIGSFCAYALARLRFKGKFFILGLVLAITTFPGIAIAAPLFKLWSNIGLFDTLTGLIIPDLTFALPLSIFILVSFFKEIPKDLEEAALVDGATYFQAFRKVVVPLAAPGMATAAILVFIGAWNEFLFAITLTSTPKARTVPAAIAFFTGATTFEVPIGTITAASVVISIPLIAMVLLFQKRIVAGLTAGAVKG
jgi:multiple sugar transport system permease protein